MIFKIYLFFKEDVERTGRLLQAVGDVATKESVTISDTFDHIGDVQKDLDVQKALALKDDGKTVDVLENQSKYSQTQIDEALSNYAQIYADVYGVNIQTAKMAVLGKYGSTYTNQENTNSNIYFDKVLNQNALESANTFGHEVAHVRQNQGQTYLRETTQLQEEYANIFGNYSADGLEFSSYAYNNVQLNKIPTNNLNLTNQDINTLKTNTNLYLQDEIKANSGDGKVDNETYWTLQDMDRTKDLQSDNAKDKVKALIETGNKKDEIFKQAINDETLRGLSQEEFDKIYNEQKIIVDKTNEIADKMILSLQASELALGGREVVKNIAEAISKKSMEFSIKNAGISSGVDITTQVVTQLYNDENLRNELASNPEETVQKIIDNINWTQTAVSAGIGSTGTKTLTNAINVVDRIKAKQVVQKQLENTSSSTLQNKLINRVEKIDSQIQNAVIIGVSPLITKPILNNDIEEKTKVIINENLPSEGTYENNR